MGPSPSRRAPLSSLGQAPVSSPARSKRPGLGEDGTDTFIGYGFVLDRARLHQPVLCSVAAARKAVAARAQPAQSPAAQARLLDRPVGQRRALSELHLERRRAEICVSQRPSTTGSPHDPAGLEVYFYHGKPGLAARRRHYTEAAFTAKLLALPSDAPTAGLRGPQPRRSPPRQRTPSLQTRSSAEAAPGLSNPLRSVWSSDSSVASTASTADTPGGAAWLLAYVAQSTAAYSEPSVDGNGGLVSRWSTDSSTQSHGLRSPFFAERQSASVSAASRRSASDAGSSQLSPAPSLFDALDLGLAGPDGVRRRDSTGASSVLAEEMAQTVQRLARLALAQGHNDVLARKDADAQA